MGGLFTVKLGAIALLLKARQYGDEHVKYGQTYGLVNACMVGQSRKMKLVQIWSKFLGFTVYINQFARSDCCCVAADFECAFAR